MERVERIIWGPHDIHILHEEAEDGMMQRASLE